MEKRKQQFWYKCLSFFFAIGTLVACGKKEDAAYQERSIVQNQEQQTAIVPQVVLESENPEIYAKGNAVYDTAAYFNPEEPKVFGINIADHEFPDGAIITSILENSQASKFDLQSNDVILKINDIPTPTASDFEKLYRSADSKIAVEITLLRKGEIRNVDIITQ